MVLKTVSRNECYTLAMANIPSCYDKNKNNLDFNLKLYPSEPFLLISYLTNSIHLDFCFEHKTLYPSQPRTSIIARDV